MQTFYLKLCLVIRHHLIGILSLIFQMNVQESAFLTMEELVEEAAETEERDKILNGLKMSAQEYRDYKVEMLDWAFCWALIMSPPAVTNKIKGSASQAEIFIQALRPIKDQFVSRKQAAALLKPAEESSGSETDENESPGDKRGAKSLPGIERPPKRSKVLILEEKMENMFQVMLNKIEKRKGRDRSGCSESKDSYDDGVEEQSFAEQYRQDTSDWEPPVLLLKHENHAAYSEALSLIPEVKESAPLIPPPAPEIKIQGIACQKLRTQFWNRIRYKEVQKKLQDWYISLLATRCWNELRKWLGQ